MARFLTVLMCLSHIYIVKGEDCSPLKLFDGSNQISGFTCIGYKTKDCQYGLSTFPGNLSEGPSVGKPRGFQATILRKHYNYRGSTMIASGVNFEWQPPLDGISRRWTKGFYLNMEPSGSGNIICRLFDLQNFDLTGSTDYRFSYELFPFANRIPRTYIIELFSLPPPSADEYEDGLLARHVITLKPIEKTNAKPDPGDWTTGIVLQLAEKQGTVSLEFDFPSEDSNATFTSFLIQLMRKGMTNAERRVYVNRTDSETMGKYTFYTVPSGIYSIQVWPLDRFLNENGKCECWKMADSFGRICVNCKVSQTANFSFTNRAPTTEATMTIPETTSHTVPETVPTTTDVAKMISGVIIAIVMALVLIVIVASVICLRRGACQQLFKYFKHERNENNNEPEKHSRMVFTVSGKVPPAELKVPMLKTKRIFLLASEDHTYFNQALVGFAEFLKVHCMCEVVFSPQRIAELQKTGNSYCWLSQQIDSADFVILVSSKVAYEMFLALREGKVYRNAQFGPQGDLFTPAIKHIVDKIPSNADLKNIMMIGFDHTSVDHYLPIAPLRTVIYRLPSHLFEFLCRIHHLDEMQMDLSKVNLPLQGNVEDLKGGSEWLTAVRKAAEYEQKNPGWFTCKFGNPEELNKPGCDTQVSVDSGYSGGRHSGEFQRRLSSISSHAVESGVKDIENSSFTKEDFFEPSIISTNTAGCIAPATFFPGSTTELDIETVSISEEFRRLNRNYEEEHFGERGQKDFEWEEPFMHTDQAHDFHVYTPSSQNGIDMETKLHLQDDYFFDRVSIDRISVSSAESV